MDNRLQLRPPQETSLVKSKALEDARKAQAQVIEECKKKGKDPPPYVLEELIGKGSFGRVYRGCVDYTDCSLSRAYKADFGSTARI